MRIAVIRSCDRDDYSAHVCYLSMKKHNVADKYIFFHEHGTSHPLIKSTGEEILYHESCGNYGGITNVKLMVTLLKPIKVRPNDYVIFCDADVIITKDITITEDHGGLCGKALVAERVQHVSGQLNIIKGWLWINYLAGGPDLTDKLHKYLSDYGLGAGCADDTLFSIFSYQSGASKRCFELNEAWVHDKINNETEYSEFMHKYIR